MRKADIDISGHGFYQIVGTTARGRRFMLRVQGNDHGTAYCDDTRLTQQIADGAVSRGLRVEVNGKEYRA